MNHLNIPIITVEEQYFYQNGERFIARGIVYNMHMGIIRSNSNVWHIQDPLDDAHYDQLLRSIKILKECHINCLWIHGHKPEVAHTESMKLLANNGIYVIFELNGPTYQFLRTRWEHLGHVQVLDHYSKSIDSVARYRNTLGVCVANHFVAEADLKANTHIEQNCRVVSETIRNMKQYMRYRNFDTGQRILPVCINDGQWSSLNTKVFEFFTDPSGVSVERVAGGKPDFYCFNHFHVLLDPYMSVFRVSQLGVKTARDRLAVLDRVGEPVDMSQSRFRLASKAEIDLGNQVAGDSDAWSSSLPMTKFRDVKEPIPVLISGYGTNLNRPRWLEEVKKLYGANMDSPVLETLSGGFAHEFYDGSNHYGLVSIELNGGLKRSSDFEHFRRGMSAAVGDVMDQTA